ncbi:MAG: hypothetical protein FK730_02040 [Asgard group archaeon]|nr:hypothetical protein [Asgard group archaeon]
MNSTKKVILYIILILSLISFLPLMVVNSKTQAGTINSIEDSIPNIDGILESTEWDDAIAQEITLYKLTDQTFELDISVKSLYSMYGPDKVLCFGIIIDDNTTDGVDHLSIIFKVGNEEIINTSSPTSAFSPGHDLKQFVMHDNGSVDGFIGDDGIGFRDDDYGGTNDFYGKCKFIANSHYTLELRMPFDTGDILTSNDPLITEGGSYELFFSYQNYTTDYTYAQVRILDAEYDFITLNIIESTTTPTINGLPIVMTFLCIFIVNTITIFHYRKQKQKTYFN